MSEIEEMQRELRDLHVQMATLQHLITQLTLQRTTLDGMIWRKTRLIAQLSMEQIRERNPDLYTVLTTPLPLGSKAKKVLH